MSEHAIHLFPAGALVALVGNPNCGKTAIFNALTGSRQKVANYAGVTVERKEGKFTTPHGKTLRILDLPGTYGLYPRSPDERVTCDVLAGRAQGDQRRFLAPDPPGHQGQVRPEDSCVRPVRGRRRPVPGGDRPQ